MKSVAVLVVLISVAVAPAFGATVRVPVDQPTIQHGIDAATAGDTVLVARGTYYEHDILMVPNLCLLGDAGVPDSVIIDAEYVGRGIDVSGCPASTRIECLTIRNGQAPAPGAYGGGIVGRESSSPVLKNLLIQNCVAVAEGRSSGGGVAFFAQASNPSFPSIVGCRFENNRSVECGGAVYCVAYVSPQFRSCEFVGNYSHDGPINLDAYGGGLFFRDRCNVSFDDCQFVGNWTDTSGGSLFVDNLSSIQMSHCRVEGNVAVHGSGGALILSDSSSGTIDSCRFVENSAHGSGGAMSIKANSEPVISNSVFVGNVAQFFHGGAIYSYEGSLPEITRCLFTNNGCQDTGHGGAIATQGGNALIQSCTIVGNYADHGAGLSAIQIDDVMTIESSVVASNLRGTGMFSVAGAPGVTLACCNVFGNEDGDWVDGIFDQYGVAGNISADPLFCSGDSLFALASNSPCLPGNHPDGTSCDQMGWSGLGCYGEPPVVLAIEDVGNDNGGQVRLTWFRSGYDAPGSDPLILSFTGFIGARTRTWTAGVQLHSGAMGASNA